MLNSMKTGLMRRNQMNPVISQKLTTQQPGHNKEKSMQNTPPSTPLPFSHIRTLLEGGEGGKVEMICIFLSLLLIRLGATVCLCNVKNTTKCTGIISENPLCSDDLYLSIRSVRSPAFCSLNWSLITGLPFLNQYSHST